MAYHLYHTEAIVLEARDLGESNRFYMLYARELGLVWARAQGVRELKSKLRGHLGFFGIVSVTLVRGRDVWRLVGAEEELAAAPRMRGAAAKAAKLLLRLVRGEGANRELYDELARALRFLHEHDLAPEHLRTCETLIAARILTHLGYGNFPDTPEEVIAAPWSEELLVQGAAARTALVRAINTALSASQL